MTNEERDRYIRDSHDILTALKPMVIEHRKTLYGNGSPGVVHRVTLIESSHAEHIKQTDGVVHRVALIESSYAEHIKQTDAQMPRMGNLIAMAALLVAAASVFLTLFK